MADDVTGNFDSAAKSLDGAVQATEQARQGVEEVRARVTRDGFAGVAANLGRVDPQLQKIQGMLVDARSQVQGASARARAVNDKSTPDEVVEHLTPVVKTADDVHGHLNALAAEVGTAQSQISAALSGGSPGQLLAKIENIKTFDRAAYKAVGAGKTSADAHLQKANKMGEH